MCNLRVVVIDGGVKHLRSPEVFIGKHPGVSRQIPGTGGFYDFRKAVLQIADDWYCWTEPVESASGFARDFSIVHNGRQTGDM
ncbi:MAG TPA: hypothetical protein DIC36_08400 [Gammaproteobacteria bacterium]|nr:hypothetical protein [Gammaproteobacteria bacterium]